MRIQDFLKDNPLFTNLDDEAINNMVQYVERKVFKENQFIFEENDPPDGMYIIVHGAIKINKLIDGFHKKTLATFTEGNFFGEMSLVDGYPRSATAIATRESVLLKFSTENYQKLMADIPYTALNIALSLSGWISMRLRNANLEIANLENWKLLHGKDGKW